MSEEKITEIDSRLRSVEQAVVELGVMSKYLKILVFVVAASLGVDLQAVVV